MTAELAFSVANLTAMLSWVLLAALPRRRWVSDTVAGVGVPTLLAVAYIVLIATNWGSSAGGFSTLANVALLFANPWMLLAGWVHYLCFDLLIGCWQVRDARERDVPHLLVVPCLALTFMFGPAGWLLYRAIRSRHRRPSAST
jgi:hypothetical protein